MERVLFKKKQKIRFYCTKVYLMSKIFANFAPHFTKMRCEPRLHLSKERALCIRFALALQFLRNGESRLRLSKERVSLHSVCTGLAIYAKFEREWNLLVG